MIIRSEHTIGPTAYVLKGIIEASIEWADRLFENKCNNGESAIAYIKLENREMTKELKVMSQNNVSVIVYIEKIFDDVDIDQIIFNEQKQYEDLDNKGYIIVKKY